MKKPFELRKSLFWDTDPDKLDFTKHKKQILTRIFMRGSIEEIALCLNYYGDETCKTVLMGVKELDNKTLSFCSAIFDTPKEEFRCYIWKQTNPVTWDY